MRVGKNMEKFIGFFQYIVIGLLAMGAVLFLFQNLYLQSGVYAALGALFMAYVLFEKKNTKNIKKS